MKRDLTALADNRFDLVVIGGGIFGAFAARDAALRGLSVALVERADFGGGTSANSYRMLHGGIRYLQHADLRRVRTSSAERRAFLRIAPHLCHPLPIVVPTRGRGRRGGAVLRAGLAAYDALTFDRNRGLEDPARQIPPSRMLSREEVLGLFPGLDASEVTGGGLFTEGQMYNPARLVLAVVRSAAADGAVVANHVEATGLVREGGRVTGVELRDRPTGASIRLFARVVLNAAGPWAEHLLEATLGVSLRPPGTYSRDLCFVVRRPWDPPSHALAIQGRTRDPDAIVSRGERHLFVAPWRGTTLVGTWHRLHTGDPDGPEVERDELAGFVDEVNAGYPGLHLRVEEISLVQFGLVPFGTNPEGTVHLRTGHRSRVVDHAAAHGMEGLVSLIGVRFTTGRREAERAVDLVFRKLGSSPPRSRTAEAPVIGGDIPNWSSFLAQLRSGSGGALDEGTLEHLARNYGTEAPRILDTARAGLDGHEAPGEDALLDAQARFGVREEMAGTLSDLVFGRTDLGTAGHPGAARLERCARVLAGELGVTPERLRVQKQELEDRFAAGRVTSSGR